MSKRFSRFALSLLEILTGARSKNTRTKAPVPNIFRDQAIFSYFIFIHIIDKE